MAKKLSIKFTSSSSTTPNVNSSTPDLTNCSIEDYNDDSSVQLVSITDEDSEDNSESLSDYNDFQPKVDPTMICSIAQDEIDLIDSKIHRGQKNDKNKKSAVYKMDKFMKHLQEALTSSSSSNNTDSNRIESNKNKDKESDIEDASPNQSMVSLLGKNSNTNNNANNNSSSSSGNTSWLNEIKFGNFVNLNKLRNEKLQKPTTNINDSENQQQNDVRKISIASGVKNHLFSATSNTTSEFGTNQVTPSQNSSGEFSGDDQNTKQSLSDNIDKKTSLSYSNLLMAATTEQDSNLSSMENTNSSNNIKEKKLKDIFKPEKDLKKKFTLFDKKFDPKSNNLAKLISPTKSSPSPIPPSPSSLASALLSPNNNTPSSNSQVFSNFLATFTNSTKTTSNNNSNNSIANKSRSASTENVNIILNNNTNNNNVGSASTTNNKINKLPTSKSMMTFRKVTKNENDINGTEGIEDLGCILSTFLQTNCPTKNPTLRRRTKSNLYSPKLGFEKTEEKSSESTSTSSSSSSINLYPLDEANRQQQQKPISRKDSTNQPQPSLQQQSTLWNTITSSNIFYYFCLFIACLSLFFLCISPLPSFLNGVIFGFLMTFFIATIGIIYLIANFFLIKSDDKKHRNTIAESVGLKRTRSKRLPVNVQVSNTDGSIYAGWVYEFIGDYTEREKNGFVSRLVYVVLSGSKLNIFVPSQEMNEKKLKQYDINRSMPSFPISSQRLIDLSKLNHKRVVLYLTKNVRNQRKYIWNKKYPICIEYSDNESSKEDLLDSNQFLPAVSTPIVSKLVIFARTCREKEEWFWAIKNSIDSSMNLKIPNSNRGSSNSLSDSPSDSKTYLFVNANEAQSSDGDPIPTQQQYLHILTRRVNYSQFMRTNILNAEGIGPGKPGMMTALTWFNVLLNRLSFDILNKPNWSAYIAKKLQRKLKRLRLPYFMESLTITEIDIGSTLPKFNAVPSVPTVDDAGLWIEFDVSYSGGFTMTLETKINLLKLSSNVENLGDISPASTPTDSPKLTQKNTGRYWSGYRAKYRGSASPCPGTSNAADINDEYCEYDSDIDSIVTSSEDEEPETAPAAPDEADADEKQKKLIRFVEKITSSQYFQKASQMNFFKKTLEGISNMSIMLTVQLNSLNGTLAINIPEPPTDRLWYGFRNDPTIQITARPKLGDHDLNLSYVTNFIEKKLRTEFFNYFVLPNMDDFFIPALNTSIEQYINVVP